MEHHVREDENGRDDARETKDARLHRRMRRYLWLMGTCIVLIVLAWNVVRFFSITAAVVMSMIAAVIPPIAVIVANNGEDR
ncbi:DUF3099 domain-containing protein [Nocardioides yefusunii]|uniref:DUF3099 domain-containing protein n=1 Tax=Nocardioides yefusunii TaxID=2500546 RepID=A0ABW1QU31_9ACTN|nr:DUF3099 domain-containing protein [Nocardioides yefusunii]